MVSIKDSLKMIGISIIGFCAVYVCAMFLNYYLDLQLVADEISGLAQTAFFDAQTMTCKVVCGVTGGCLLLTSVVLLIFYIKHYIDTHKKELGILKALGYDNFYIAIRFGVFGLSVLTGTVLGYLAACITMPKYYELQNKDGILPDVPMRFHIGIVLLLTIVPAMAFAGLAIIISLRQLRVSALHLIRGGSLSRIKKIKDSEDMTFLMGLKKSTTRQKKSLVFFIAFGSFCFSAMTQMSASMDELSSKMMSIMMMSIGFTLAFAALLLALTSVMKANQKTAAMMRVFGYTKQECQTAIFGGYRLWNYLGFALGSIYQYGLLKLMVSVVFKDVEGVPEYHFDFKVCVIALIAYLLIYEAAMKIYGKHLSRMPIKEIMME